MGLSELLRAASWSASYLPSIVLLIPTLVLSCRSVLGHGDAPLVRVLEQRSQSVALPAIIISINGELLAVQITGPHSGL